MEQILMEGHTAVITGAANGMGLAAATKCALEYKMKVVMCDVVENELNQDNVDADSKPKSADESEALNKTKS